MISPASPEAIAGPMEKVSSARTARLARANLQVQRLAAVSPVNTDVPRVVDRSTPQAQSKQELEDEWQRKRRTSSLAGRMHSDCPR